MFKTGRKTPSTLFPGILEHCVRVFLKQFPVSPLTPAACENTQSMENTRDQYNNEDEVLLKAPSDGRCKVHSS